MSERVLLVGEFGEDQQRVADALGVEVVTEEQADALRQLSEAPKREPTRAERFVAKAMARIDERNARELEARRLARRGSEATQAAKIDAAQAKRERRKARRAQR